MPSSTTTTFTASPVSPAVGSSTTATATVKDASGAVIAGQPVRFIVTGASTATSGVINTDASGQAAFPVTSSAAGTVDIKLSVINSSGVEQFSKDVYVTFGSALNPAPKLSQTSSDGVVTLTMRVNPSYKGLTVIFFRRSGMTGQVVPAGTAVVNANGVATRVLHQKAGQILALYGKLLNSTGISSQYSNTIAFKVL